MTAQEFFAADQFARLAGIELVAVSHGHAVARMPVGEAVRNASGYCQGGAIFTLCDLAFAAAVNTHGYTTVSVNTNIVFLRPADHGVLTATADELFDHRRLPYAQVRVTDEEGALVAVFTGSGYRKHEPIPIEL